MQPDAASTDTLKAKRLLALVCNNDAKING